jgi:hypothetical protein
MKKRVAIIQSNYVPWKGYFDAIAEVDEFVLLDEVQYTKRDWRNRNKIPTRDGLKWLTVPVAVKGKYHQRIDETEISDPGWAEQHWKTLAQTYARAPHFDWAAAWLEPLYERAGREQRLSAVNRLLIEGICERLGIDTKLSWSTDYDTPDLSRGDLILALCKATGADVYLSGPAARSYMDEERFAEHGVEVGWLDYTGYPEYQQLTEPFEHGVSIVDMLFNLGQEAPASMKAAREGHVEVR